MSDGSPSDNGELHEILFVSAQYGVHADFFIRVSMIQASPGEGSQVISPLGSAERYLYRFRGTSVRSCIPVIFLGENLHLLY